MAKKISELSVATHSTVTPEARILVNEVNAGSSTGYTTKQMSIAELNAELLENYHYLTSNDQSSSSGSNNSSSSSSGAGYYYYLDDDNITNDWEKVCPIIFYDPYYEALFVFDKNLAKRYIGYGNSIVYGPDSEGNFDSNQYDDYVGNSDSSHISSRLELFDYLDEYEYVDNNASSGC